MEDGEAEAVADTVKTEDEKKEDVVVMAWFLVWIEKYDIVVINTLNTLICMYRRIYAKGIFIACLGNIYICRHKTG